MAQREFSRRNYLINPMFQWRHAGTIAGVVFLVSSIISMVLYGILHEQARLRLMNPIGYRAEVTWIILLSSLGFAAVTAGGVGLWSIIVTHRIYGPVFVLKRSLLEIAAGRWPNMRPLRSKDEFKDLFEAFATAVEALKARQRSQMMLVNHAVEALKHPQRAGDHAPAVALASIVEQLEELRREAADALSDDTRKPAATASPERTPDGT
jgi:hypothetical protein